MAKMIYAFALLAIAASVSAGGVKENCQPVIVLSFDGISPSEAASFSNLITLKSKAATVKALKSVFPTKTFSTHFSVATGVKPGVHGVIGNTQYNKADKKVRNHPDQWRFVSKILPIWGDNERQGGNSGTMMWPGAHLQYGGKVVDVNKEYPSDFKDDGDDVDEEEGGAKNDDDNYDGGVRADFNVDYEPKKMEWEERIDQIIKWVKEGDNDKSLEPANLVMAYFEDKGTLHVNTRETAKKEHLKKVDNIIGYFQKKIKDSGLNENVDIILMSDHGTSASEAKDIVKISDILTIQKEDENILASGPLAYISPEDDDYQTALTQLKDSSENTKYDVYEKADLKKWDMDKSEAVLKQIITVVAKPPYTFFTEFQLPKILERYEMEESQISQYVNGYDNAVESMDGFFYGIGPSFVDNKVATNKFELDEVYPLIKLLTGMPLENTNDVQTNNDLDKVVLELLEDKVKQRIN